MQMNTNKIQINNKQFKLDDIQQILLNSELSQWEQGVYHFMLNWFDKSDFILQKTSGSTGNPKEIRLKKSAMKASAKKTLAFFNLQKGDTALLCLPIDYIAGKMMVLRALLGGLNLLIVEPNGKPEIPTQTIHFAAMVPMQVQKLIDAGYHFHNIKQLIIGGAAVVYNLQQAIKKLPVAVYASYGMTETCSHIALQRLNGPNSDAHFRLLDGVSISTNAQGCLVINAPGLYPEPLQTNDLVDIISPHEFRWLGRADNVINSGGLKIFPEELELKISKLIGRECLIVSVPDKLLGQKAVLVLEGTEENPAIMLDKIKSSIGKHRTPKSVFFVEKFPRNSAMKIDRKAIMIS